MLALIGLVSVGVVALVAYLLLGPTAARDRRPVALLPVLNALLNGTSAVLLSTGWIFVRRRHIAAHRACMLGAFSASLLFLVSYVVYHALAGSRAFAGTGLARWVYLPLLVSHIVLAAAMVPFVLTTLYRALGGDYVRHAWLARRTLPVWLYVSVTGVIIYWMLYHLFP